MANLIKSKVINNERLNAKFYRLKLIFLDQKIAFTSGQFVTIKIKKNIFRSYSIFSSPRLLPHWEIFVDITPGGPGTTFLKSLKPGEIIETTPPVGNFIPQKDPVDYVIFGATGCGLAPARPLLESILEKSAGEKVVFFWGLRHNRDITLTDLLQNLQNKFPNFSYEIVLSRPEGVWPGKTGHVTEYILGLAKNSPKNKTAIYLAGSGEYVKEAIGSLKKVNFPEDKIYFEACYFTPPAV